MTWRPLDPRNTRRTSRLLVASVVSALTWSGAVIGPVTPAQAATPATGPAPSEVREIGRSVQGRSIVARRYGRAGGKVVLAVGSIHGNERAGIPLINDLARTAVPDGYTLWVITTANPDGTHLGQRQNANKVDLNRNFPTRWKRQACPSKYCSGPHAASEPETRALVAFLSEIRPRLTVFYHSVGMVVDVPGDGVASRAAVNAYAKTSWLPARGVSCGPGGCTGNATQFINSNDVAATAFVVELPCDRTCLPAATRQRHIRAFWAAALLS